MLFREATPPHYSVLGLYGRVMIAAYWFPCLTGPRLPSKWGFHYQLETWLLEWVLLWSGFGEWLRILMSLPLLYRPPVWVWAFSWCAYSVFCLDSWDKMLILRLVGITLYTHILVDWGRVYAGWGIVKTCERYFFVSSQNSLHQHLEYVYWLID